MSTKTETPMEQDELQKEIQRNNQVLNVVVHPLVLLSVVDHFNRMGKVGNVKRVVGVLLGSNRRGVLDVSNSFAVPFDEDDKDKLVWFLDHDYLENMYSMFKKVNAREKIVGWYHTGPKLHQNDVLINELIRKYCPNSVLVIIDAKPKDLGLPTEAYIATEEVHDDGTPTTKTFEHVPSEIGAEEAEEVGVEHLLRDIKDTTVGTLSQRITNQLLGIKGLHSQLGDIHAYLEKVASGKLPINHTIIYQLQDIFNLLPDMHLQEFVKSVYIKTNDQMLVVYLASLISSTLAIEIPTLLGLLCILDNYTLRLQVSEVLPWYDSPQASRSNEERPHVIIKTQFADPHAVYRSRLSIIVLHNLINNKLQNSDAEKIEGKKDGDKKKDDKEKKEGEKDKKDADKDADKDKKDKDKKDSDSK